MVEEFKEVFFEIPGKTTVGENKIELLDNKPITLTS